MITFKVTSQGLFTRWYVKRVEVKNVCTGKASNFVVGKWLQEGETSFLECSCVLLHCEADIKAKQLRHEFKKQQRALYNWADGTQRGMPTHLAVPEGGLPLIEHPFDKDLDWAALIRHAGKHLTLYGGTPGSMGRPSSLQAYMNLIDLSGEKTISANPWENDTAFAEMYHTGPFAHLLSRLEVVPQTWGPALLASKVDKCKLYVVDLYVLEGLPCQSGRIVNPAMIVFASTTGTPSLVPVLIQLTMVGRPHLFTAAKSTPNDWILAKMHAACATAHVHIIGHTLVETHFGIEPFVIAMRRNLPDCHPVAKVLMAHVQGVLYACMLARKQLLGSSGELVQVFALTAEGIQTLVERVYNRWCITRDNDLREDLTAKHVDVPYFPYRDDGLLIWNVMEEYVTTMLSLWYLSDEDVAADSELHAFKDDLTTCGLKNRETDVLSTRRFTSNLKDVVALVTSLIWTVTVQASTLTSPLWNYGCVVPLLPLTMHRTSAFEKATPGMILESLPPLDLAAKQLAFLRAWTMPYVSTPAIDRKDVLGQLAPESGMVHPLGFFEEDIFMHPTPKLVITSFQQSLLELTGEISILSHNPALIPNRLLR
jgi:hypothetical protein